MGISCTFKIWKYMNSIWIRKLRVLYMYFNYRPEPTQTWEKQTRIQEKPTQTDFFFLRIPIGSKYLGSEGPRPEIFWTKPNPKTQTSRPKCMNEHSGTHLDTSQFFRVSEFWVFGEDSSRSSHIRICSVLMYMNLKITK